MKTKVIKQKVSEQNATTSKIRTIQVVLCLLVLGSSLFTSCKSVHGYSGRTPLYGIVTYNSGKPALGCIVSVDGKETAVCNVTGLFTIQSIKAGSHVFTVSYPTVDKSSSEVFSKNVVIESRNQFLSFIIPDTEIE